MTTDKISDLIIKIKNGNKAGKPFIVVNQTKLIESLVEVLHKEGYVGEIAKKKKKNLKVMEITLNYEGKSPKVTGTKRISKPSRRIYISSKELKPFRQNSGLSVISTPKGIMSGREARKANLGGEFLFNIW